MAEVFWLRANESPPKDGDWVLIAQDREGRPPGAVAAHDNGMTFFIPAAPSEVDRSEAIARARAWADRNGVDTVYVAHAAGRSTSLDGGSAAVNAWTRERPTAP